MRWARRPRFALLRVLVLAGCLLFGAAERAWAHPHVWVDMASELIFDKDGSLVAIKHAWTFDDVFSAFATLGIPAKTKGQFTREELAALAEVNVTSLKEYGYFTSVKVKGRARQRMLSDPVDYWLAYDPQLAVLTLHFTLPIKTPLRAQAIDIEVFDPEFFVYFGFRDKEPIAMSGPTRACTAAQGRPAGAFPDSFRNDPRLRASEAFAGMGAQFANVISVRCP